MQLFVRSATLALLASLPLAAPGDVHVVAADGSGDFTSIQAAVDAAAAADTLLVKAGSYAGFSVSGKSLVITAEAGATPIVTGKVSVSGIGGGGTLVLDGLRIDSPAGRAFVALACPGTVWLEDCQILGGPGSSDPFNDCVGIDLENCAAVVLLRTTATAGDSLIFMPNGLQATGSQVYAYDSSFTGDKHFPGGRGAALSGGFLFASGTTFRGGDVQDGTLPPFGCDGGDGGHALQLQSGTVANTMDCTFLPGQGGAAVGSCTPGFAGQDVSSVGSTYTDIAGLARSFEVDSPMRENNGAVLHYSGQTGDLVVALFGLATQPIYQPTLRGTLLPAFPPLVFTLGVATSGVLDITVPVGPLPLGLESLAIPLQAGVVTSTGALVLGAGSELVILDGAF